IGGSRGFYRLRDGEDAVGMEGIRRQDQRCEPRGHLSRHFRRRSPQPRHRRPDRFSLDQESAKRRAARADQYLTHSYPLQLKGSKIMKLRDSYLTAAAALSSAAVAALLSGCEPANSQPHAGMRPPQVAEAEVKTARANLADARLNLGYTRVEAPIAGIASRAQRSEGNYVSGPDVLLTTVSQIDPIYVLFSVSDEERVRLAREADTGRLKLPRDGRFEVTVKLADGSVYKEAGKPNFTDVRVSGSTSTSEARAELPNPAGFLHPGQFVRVTLKGAERPAAILVPQRAVLEGPKGKFVYLVNSERKAEPRPVEVGDW